MAGENVSAEAGGGEINVTVEDLHRAAEETKQAETQETLVEKPAGELDAEKPKETEQEPAEEPTDNATRTKLGMKVAAQEKQLEEMRGLLQQSNAQLKQVTDIITHFAQAAQQQQQSQVQTDEPEYIPTETKEFLSFLEKREQQRQTQAQSQAMAFAHEYVNVIEEIGKGESDPAMVAEIKKLTTEGGQPFNKKYSNSASADATTNFFRAKAYILEQRISKGKTPENPLKGGTPENPLGVPSSSTAKKPDKSVELDAFAKRAAAAWGYSGKALEDVMKG